MTFSPTVAVLLVLLGVAVGAFGTIVGSGGGFILIAGALAVGSVSRSLFDLLMAIVLLALAIRLLRGEPGDSRLPRGHLSHRDLTAQFALQCHD